MGKGTLKAPLVDVTTIQGIESGFRSGARDPYGPRALAHLTDLALYSDKVRYPVAYTGARPKTSTDVVRPPLVEAFDAALPGLFEPVPFSADKTRIASRETTLGALDSLGRFVRANPTNSKALITLHGQSSIRSEHSRRVGTEFVFDVEPILENPRMEEMAARLGCEKHLLLYTLDMALRYPIYGALTGKDEWYLSHQVRTAISMPNLTARTRGPPDIPIPLGDLVYKVARDGPMVDYVKRVVRLRDLLNENGIRGAPSGEVERTVVRSVAQQAGLPGKLRGYHRSVGVASCLLGFVGLVPLFGAPAAALAATITIGSAFWDGHVPSRLTQQEWLRFAIRYDVEDRLQEHP